MNRRYGSGRRAVLVLLALVGGAGLGLPVRAVMAQTPEARDAVVGEWVGAARIPTGLLGLTVELRGEGGAWSAIFGIPAEGVSVPASGVQVAGDSIVVTIVPGRELRGRVMGDSIVGELVFESRSMLATLGRVGTAVAERLAAELAAAAEAARPASLVRTAEGSAVAEVEPRALERLVAAANASHSHALVVLRGGELVGAWHAGGARQPIETMSVTKSIVNLAIGRLVTTGAIASIDQPVRDFFPEWGEGAKSEITIRHLLNHTSGLESPMPTGPIYESDDFVRFALDAELVSPPGTAIEYNNNATNLLAGLVERVTGERLDRFLGNDLFASLGITDFRWSLDRSGNPHGMSGAQLHAEDLARLGQLVLQRGQWEGRRLIDADWFAESLRPGSSLSDGAGLLWWLIHDGDDIVGYRADGYLGQYLVIYPDQELVAVRMVAQTPAYDPETDGFIEFQTLVRELVPVDRSTRE